MRGNGMTKLKRELLVCFLAFTVVVAFTLPVPANDTVIGRIQALDRIVKKITISGTEYSLSDDAPQTTLKIGRDVESTIKGNEVRSLTRPFYMPCVIVSQRLR